MKHITIILSLLISIAAQAQSAIEFRYLPAEAKAQSVAKFLQIISPALDGYELSEIDTTGVNNWYNVYTSDNDRADIGYTIKDNTVQSINITGNKSAILGIYNSLAVQHIALDEKAQKNGLHAPVTYPNSVARYWLVLEPLPDKPNRYWLYLRTME